MRRSSLGETMVQGAERMAVGTSLMQNDDHVYSFVLLLLSEVERGRESESKRGSESKSESESESEGES